MDTWLIADGKSELAAVAERALKGRPQVVVPGGREEDAVVVVARAEYARLTEPQQNLFDFLRNSPLAEAVRDGLLDLDNVNELRDRGMGRDVDLA